MSAEAVSEWCTIKHMTECKKVVTNFWHEFYLHTNIDKFCLSSNARILTNECHHAYWFLFSSFNGKWNGNSLDTTHLPKDIDYTKIINLCDKAKFNLVVLKVLLKFNSVANLVVLLTFNYVANHSFRSGFSTAN